MAEAHRVRRQGVAQETIEGETVVLNLETGTYFSLTNAASMAWTLLEGGADKSQLADALASHYRGERTEIDAAVNDFIAELAREGLIESHAGTGSTVARVTGVGEDPFPGLGIQRYTDVEELLMIDPVHEVDEGGWPVRAKTD